MYPIFLTFFLPMTSPVSKQKVDEPGQCQRTSRPFPKKFYRNKPRLLDKYSVSTSQIIHEGLEVKVLDTYIIYHLNGFSLSL